MSAITIDEQKDAVKSVLDGYVTSIENADIEHYARIMAHDADMVNFGTGAYDRAVGWETLKAGIEAQNAALSDTKITVSDVAINLSRDGQFAWATSLWNFNASMGVQAIELPIRCTWVLEKRSEWVVVHFHKSVGMAG